MRTLDIAMTAVCAALYTVVGYLTNLGIVSPVVGVVRFWPAVIVPAIFAILFGRWVGGIGAAIGIVFSDMIHPGHGILLLSITVGLPSNFIMFYLLGYIGRKNIQWKHIGIGLGLGSLIPIMILFLFTQSFLSYDVTVLFLSMFIACYVLTIVVGYLLPEWKSFEFASIVGQAMGAAWIGFGLWAYSYVLPLPLSLGWERNAPLYAGFMWLVWTFATEIPFLLVLGPLILKACYKAFPSLKPSKNEQDKR